LFKGCLNWSYFLDDGLDRHFNTKTPITLALNKAFKKGSKKTDLKGLKALKKKLIEIT